MSSNHADLINPSRIVVRLASSADYAIESVFPLTITNDEVVMVQFVSSRPSADDWIGAYSPANASVTQTAPIKFGMCDQTLNSSSSQNLYLQTGRSTLQFNLTNLRSDVAFHYFKGGLSQPLLVASTSIAQVVRFADNNQPLRNRIVPTGDPDVFSLLWSSASSEVPMVRWGTTTRQYTYSAVASTRRIEKSDMCGGVASGVGWKDLGLLHAVNVTGIQTLNLSSRRIYYTFGDNKTANFSPEWVFQVPPSAGRQPFDGSTQAITTSHNALQSSAHLHSQDTMSTAPPTTSTAITNSDTTNTATAYSYPQRGTQVILMADLGVGASDDSADTKVFSEACIPAFNTTKSIGHRVARGEVDMVLLSGDLSYANGYLSNWEFFLDAIAPIAGGSLFLTTVGNHESVWAGSNSLYQGQDSGGECGLSADLLPMPSPASRNAPWWSYDIGLIHFVGMSTEHDYAAGSAQHAFLTADLASVDRARTPWVVFTGHRPAYVDSHFCCGWGKTEDSCTECMGYSDVAVMGALQREIDPLLQKYQVNLAFAGHFHNVQRQSAVFQGKVVQHSTPEVDTEGHIVHVQRNPQATVWMVIGSAGNGPSISNERYEWSEASWDNMYGYAVLTATNSTHLQWQFINSADDQVVDRLLITQNFDTWNTSTSGGVDSTSSYYSHTAQLVVLFIGTVILVLSFIGAYIHSQHTKRALRRINGQHVMLDNTEHSAHSLAHNNIHNNNDGDIVHHNHNTDASGQPLPVFSIETYDEAEDVV